MISTPTLYLLDRIWMHLNHAQYETQNAAQAAPYGSIEREKLWIGSRAYLDAQRIIQRLQHS